MQEIAAPTPLGPKRNPPGPVVIWNLIRRCNLTCKHCYSISADTNFPGELSTEQVYTVMDDLKGFKVPVLILSGGDMIRNETGQRSHPLLFVGHCAELLVKRNPTQLLRPFLRLA